MKKISFLLVFALVFGLFGCSDAEETPQIVATTAPVYTFATALCADTPLQVGQLITENISCLHDYSLSVPQVRMAEGAEVIAISGAGLEDFMSDLLADRDTVIDCSVDISLLEYEESHDHNHAHEEDSHIWLSPENAGQMAKNLCDGLSKAYPAYTAVFEKNLTQLESRLTVLQDYGNTALSDLSCRQLITFHDGFGYLADAFDLTIAAAIEEESGSEASAKELIDMITLVQSNQIPAIFTEINGSISAPQIISAETGVSVHALNMGMGNADYFEMMRHNIDTLKEALG